MRSCTAMGERCQATGLYIGHVPGFLGVHSQGETLQVLKYNLWVVVALVLDDRQSKERKR